MINKRIVLPFLFFIAFLVACENDIKTIRLLTSPENAPVETSVNNELLYSDSAQLKIKLIAPLMNRFESDHNYLELPKGVDVTFYNDTMGVSSRLTANYAIRYLDNGTMEARNNVVVTNVNGDRLNTEHLIWDEVQQKIYTNAKVVITTADEVLKGEGLESNRDFSVYKILKPTGSFSVADSTNTDQDGNDD
jgi:LPS export ABC transporter protein LptC